MMSIENRLKKLENRFIPDNYQHMIDEASGILRKILEDEREGKSIPQGDFQKDWDRFQYLHKELEKYAM